jgi:DNA adenine methylase
MNTIVLDKPNDDKLEDKKNIKFIINISILDNIPNNIKFTKPIIKWVGGKSQLIKVLSNKYPKSFNNYHEIFLGGGSVLISVLELKKKGFIHFNKCNAYDKNQRLISLYKHIQSNKDKLLEEVNKLKTTYKSLPFLGEKGRIKVETIEEAMTSQAKYYYYQRNRFINIDKTSVESAALFIFINKTCFRGVYREGPNGFNVPFGNYKKTPNIISKKDLDYLSELIKDVHFQCLEFKDSLKEVSDGDFVYLDPPYAPETDTSFTSYTSDGFNINDHTNLFNLTKNLTNNTKFMMNNHSVKLVEEAFDNKKYNIFKVNARRAINSKNPGKGTKEIIITNY